MIIPYIFSFALSLISHTAASTCWRDTTCEKRSASFSGSWDSYNHSPSSRTISPVKILTPDHAVISTYPGSAALNSSSPIVIFDFGQEVGGIVTVKYTSSSSGTLGLAFSEARNWTGTVSDGSDGTYHPGGDGALSTNVSMTTDGSYTIPDASLRGGFRYLSVFVDNNSATDVEITSVELEISFQPTWSDLRSYGGYFYSNEDLINRIWYAGAYTLQTTAVAPKTGRVYPLLQSGWRNDADLGTSGATIFVDGAKRDRATWAGDLGIALPSSFVSLGDYDSAKNALQLLYDLQKTTGELLMVGPPINLFGSDTYHLTALIATYEYVLYSGDEAFLIAIWAKVTLAINYIIKKIDNSGLFSVTSTADWGRLSLGGRNTEANALMYRALVTATIMGDWANDTSQTPSWKTKAETLKTAINNLSWDSSVGAFKDTDTNASIHPEDGNSLALQYNMSIPERFQNISDNLVTNWGPIGAICPELPGNIVPYVESMEIKGHFAVRQTSRALQLMRLSWGWYLNNPYGTGSSLIEGYLTDGSFGYRHDTAYGEDYSYTSHSHGWSTGPTHALSMYILGIQMVTPGGKTWLLEPQFGNLTTVEGGYTTPVGKFSAKWAVNDVSGPYYTLTYDVPTTTSGTLLLPVSTTQRPAVSINGASYADGTYDAVAGTLTIPSQPGGLGNITVSSPSSPSSAAPGKKKSLSASGPTVHLSATLWVILCTCIGLARI